RVAIEDYEAGIIGVEDWHNAILCPMVDARRMEVYVQLFDSEAHALNDVSAEIIDEQSFASYRTEHPFVIFGNGAAKCREVLGAIAISVLPSVRGMAHLAEEAFQRGEFVDTAYFEPFYLKDFVVTTTRKPLF
ncbi:MAG: tRNA (adenosine(37)-N6)-threonylcarbamoyltransferase complex dimerization subunit type 1 TsaB, partial [Alistipes sp.]|nr:tRNA (adenosine(37)-N6)-threonylcarbamoyltransferase complex dimerization subunit type 1 TsaB [Alistipes sp.]